MSVRHPNDDPTLFPNTFRVSRHELPIPKRPEWERMRGMTANSLADLERRARRYGTIVREPSVAYPLFQRDRVAYVDFTVQAEDGQGYWIRFYPNDR
jgi:hypothetical protein